VSDQSHQVKSCKSCGAPVVWATTQAGKTTPLDAKPVRVAMLSTGDLFGSPRIVDSVNGYVSHFSTCPNADKHRRKR